MPGNQCVQPVHIAGQRPHLGGRPVDADLVADACRTSAGPLRGPFDELDDHGRQLGALVLLEEVATADDGGVRLVRGTGHLSEERAFAASRDRRPDR